MVQSSHRRDSLVRHVLAVPVGQAIAAGLRALGLTARKDDVQVHSADKRTDRPVPGPKRKHARHSAAGLRRAPPTRLYAVLGLAVVLLFVFIEPSQSRWAFYKATEWGRISPVLRFAEEHRDGRIS